MNTDQFIEFLFIEFQLVYKSAQRYCNVYKRLDLTKAIGKIERSAAYLLAEKKVSTHLRTHFIARLNQGENVTYKQVKAELAKPEKQKDGETTISIHKRRSIFQKLFSSLHINTKKLKNHKRLSDPILEKSRINIIEACYHTLVNHVLKPLEQLVNEDIELSTSNPSLRIIIQRK